MRSRRLTKLFLYCSVAVIAIYLSLGMAFANPPFKLGVGQSTVETAKSNIGILGIRYLHKLGGRSRIVEIYPDTPASASGIRIGDQIISVDAFNTGYAVDVSQYDANQVYELISGPPGTQIRLKLYRCDSANCYNYTSILTRMERNEIPSDYVFHQYR